MGGNERNRLVSESHEKLESGIAVINAQSNAIRKKDICSRIADNNRTHYALGLVMLNSRHNGSKYIITETLLL